MKNYNNALTRLNESKTLHKQNEILFKMVARSLVELEMLTSGSLLTENEMILMEASFLKKIKQKWKNLWSKEAAKDVESSISKLPQEDQDLLKNTSKKIADKYGKECIEQAKSEKLTGEDLKIAVQNCLSSKIKSSSLNKIMGVFRKPLAKQIVGSVLLVLVSASVLGLPGKFDKQSSTDYGTFDDKMEVKYDGELKNNFMDADDLPTFDLASQQGVTVKGDLDAKIAIDYDTGSAKLKPDQQQKINDKASEIINNVKERIDAGQTDITVKINVQGNASNTGGKWNHNNDTKSDTLNQDRANAIENSLESLVKTLEAEGIKVEMNKTVGEQGSSVQANSKEADATETGSISVDIDGETPTPEPVTTTDTSWEQGDTTNYERDFPSTPLIPQEQFLDGNRNMQLAYLAQNFVAGGESLWSNLGIKEGTKLPNGFFDAVLGQGKVDQEKYLRAFYNHLDKNDSFTKKLNVTAWLAKTQGNKVKTMVNWISNTRKNIGGFIKQLSNTFDNFNIGDRQKAKTAKPGEMGKAMGVAGESIDNKGNIILEVEGSTMSKVSGYSKEQFMKNLPQFMQLLSMMYYDVSGGALSYDKEEVLKTCKEYGCKDTPSKKVKKTKSDDYQFTENNQLMEDIKRIKSLMK